VLGLQPGEAVGQSAFEIFDGYPEVTERFRQTLNGEEVDAELNIGGTILNAWACPFHDENGNVAGCIGMATDVTERRTQKTQLEETKEQYRTLIDHFPGAVFLYNEDLRCVLTGGEALEEVGMNAEEIEGAIPRERYPPEIADPLEDRLQAALSGEQSVMEQSYQGRHFRIETLPIQEGETCMAVSVDITERKKAQQALKRSQERLTMALEGGEIGTWDWDLETGEVIFNRQWAEMLGYTRQELDFHFSTWEALVHPEDLPRAMTMLDKYIQGDRDTYNPEIRMQTKSGDWKWIQTIGKVIDRDESGEMTRAAGIHLDIDERKKAERELRRSEQRFRKIFENAAIGIAIVNDEGWPLRANPALQSMLGYSEEELRALHFSEVTHPDDIEKDLGLFEELNEEERDEYQIDKRYVRKDGEVFWGRLIVSRLDLDDGTKHVSLVENISEQKQHERAIRQAKDEAEEAARLKSIMLANMSHEVRTPLTSMIGLSGLLTKQLEGRAAKLARLIQKSGKRLEETMESALQLSQLEAGSYTPAHTTLSLPSLARRIVDEFELDAKDSGVSLQVETPGKPTEAYVDEMAVRRVISNLVDNAIKFTPENGHVTIRTYAKDSNMVTVEVEDTGVGISEEALPRIFQAFQQESEGLTREYEGVGLGLSIVRKLVEALGGRIEVDTEKGRGTCMSVHLPRPNESKSS